MSNYKYSDVKMPKTITSMKKIDGIIITVTNYTYNPGQNSIKKKVSQETYNDFQIYMAAEMIATLTNAIDNQRYSKKWKPLSINYLTHKQRHHLSLNIWEATGQMKKSIKCYKNLSFINVGFTNRDVYPKTYAKINTIARYLEYGSRDNTHPPSRPLFRPITIYMRKNVSRYWKRYQNELQRLNKQYIYQ